MGKKMHSLFFNAVAVPKKISTSVYPPALPIPFSYRKKVILTELVRWESNYRCCPEATRVSVMVDKVNKGTLSDVINNLLLY